MKKKKTYKRKESEDMELNERGVMYSKTDLRVFHSFEEQEAYELEQMALLSREEIFLHLRKCINLAYGMHGFDPDKLPGKHKIRFKEEKERP